ncbi:MAG TPA: tetratricopeptide repeat protein [Pirellulaceae bacterium]|nr:tetratricopeptide repeat protein [Pirellulaceae bacterium]
MLRKVALLALSALLFALSGGFDAAFGQFDQVYQRQGVPSKGNISAMSKDEVTLDMSGVARNFAVNEIARITYADEPNELNNARNAVLQQNWGQAEIELKKLDGQSFARDLIRQDVEYYKALCMAKKAMTEGGDKNAAATAMLNYVKLAPNNYHFYAAAEVLGDLAVSSGAFDKAATYYKPIAGAPWPDYQMRAGNAVGRALLAQKSFPEAQKQFDDVLAIDLSTPEAAREKLFANVGKAQCLAETGQAEAGIALLQDIISKNDPADQVLFARTYNALGRCYLKTNKPKDARDAYLFTEMLFTADSDAHAEALYHLSKLWTDLNKSDRAVAARNTLRERYSGSIWNTLE